MDRNNDTVRRSRRSVLSAFAGTGVGVALASVTSTPVAADAAGTGTTDDPTLGSFESGLDGWTTDGDVRLSRVARAERPVSVTEGEYALQASVEGEASPAIARPVGSVDLVGHPYLVADVAPGRVAGTDAPVAFRFRLHRPADDSDGESVPVASEPVAESDVVTVRQAMPGRLFWDASDVAADRLDAAALLEIRWHPAGGDSAGEGFAYRGGVVFDDVRASASVDPVGRARLAATLRDLQFEHGAREGAEVTARSGGREDGALVFADGATEPYRFERLADDRFRLVVAGTEVRFGRGWSR